MGGFFVYMGIVMSESEQERYQKYLCSPEWWAKRNAVLRRARSTCERCKASKAVHVHHLTYIRKYRERLDDLIAVCESCHDAIHNPKEKLRNDISTVELQKIIARARKRHGIE
jgi:5-methylcytosine-specific restriction endonuclease McrA